MVSDTKEVNPTKKTSFFIAVLFFAIYLLGELFPSYWWFSHSSHFLKPAYKLLFFASALFFLFYSNFIKKIIPRDLIPLKKEIDANSKHLFIWSISIFAGLLYYHFPMVADFYGEAYLLNSQASTVVESISPDAKNDLFHFGLNPWAGQKTIFALISYLSLYTGQSIYNVFLYFDAFFGFCFMLTYLYFINQQLKSITWKIILAIAALTAPFTLNFFGHLEINAIVLWAILTWMVLFVKHIQNPSSYKLLILFLFLLFCLKLHAIALLFVPFLIMTCIAYYRKNNEKIFTWGNMMFYIIAPIFFIGMICYFFILKDFADPRNLDYDVQEYDRLFLPLFSPEPPLDKYNLFSLNHLFDYFGILILGAPIALFLMVVLPFLFKSAINWKEPILVLSLSILFLFFSLFFVVNPLLSMPMDWDLFTYPSPVLLVVVALVIKQLDDRGIKCYLLPLCLSLAILNLPFFLVHQSQESLSYKLEDLGVRIYHTYYEWSSQTIHYGLGLIPENRALQIERKNKILNELKPFALEYNDREYGKLWAKDGAYFLDVHKDVPQAYVYLENAVKYYPENQYNKLLLLECCILLDLPDQAFQFAIELNENLYPDEASSGRTVVQTALLAKKYKEAKIYAGKYLEHYPEDENMARVYKRLSQNDRVEELKNLFYVPAIN